MTMTTPINGDKLGSDERQLTMTVQSYEELKKHVARFIRDERIRNNIGASGVLSEILFRRLTSAANSECSQPHWLDRPTLQESKWRLCDCLRLLKYIKSSAGTDQPISLESLAKEPTSKELGPDDMLAHQEVVEYIQTRDSLVATVLELHLDGQSFQEIGITIQRSTSQVRRIVVQVLKDIQRRYTDGN